MRTEHGGGIPPLSCSPVLMPMPSMKMAGQGVARVVHRCQDAKENQKLDLSECLLMHVPDGVYHLMRDTEVLWLNLSSNVLRKIPPKFTEKFNNLTELNLSHNQIHTLPDELVDVKDLQRLDISHNHFHSLPRVIFKLPKLNFLNVSNNSLTDVDVARLISIPTLQEVNFESNPLSKSSYDQLKSVGRLTVHVSEYQDEFEMEDLDSQ